MKSTDRTEEETERLKKFYLDGAQKIRDKHFSFTPENRFVAGMELARERTALVDSFITKASADRSGKCPEGVSLVALGGYGRKDLCPFSDIDLLVLHKPGFEEVARKTVENIFYPIWDMNLDLGHAVRTANECAQMCAGDFVTFTSLLDSRFITGDPAEFAALAKGLSEDVMPSVSARFIDEKLTEARIRRKKFGSSVWMLEPNVKEAEGAQRDLNTMLWLCQAKYKIKAFDELPDKGIMSEKEFRVTFKCMSFLLLVRSHLHYLAGRKHDKLSFDFQPDVAKFFGYQDSSKKAVEKFMRIYYLRAGLVSENFQRVVERVSEKSSSAAKHSKIRHLDHGFTISDGVLSVTGKNVFRETPVNLIRAFEYADRHGAEMSRYMRALIREHVPLIDEEVRNSPEFSRIFTGILKNGSNVYKVLSLMNRLRFLAHYIPEFGRIVCMMQHNAYHLYTVDIHSLFLVNEVERLFKYEYEDEFPLLTKVAESVVSRDVLYLACLLHDIGKGSAGHDHARVSKEMVEKIGVRLGLPPDDAAVLEFLVENHQIMSDFSQKQDINDSELVSKFAESVGDDERLSLLYILTFADLRSVGTEVWNNWKSMLLRKLYFSSLRSLEPGRPGQTEDADMRKETVCREVERASSGEITASEAARAVENMPLSYLFNHLPADIGRHISIMKSARNGIATDVIHHEDGGYDEFIFWGKDRKSLFRTLCGAVSANGLNILGARAESGADGMALDIMYLNRLGGSAADSPELWEKLDGDIRAALGGTLDIDAVMKKRKQFSPVKRKLTSTPPRIVFDNEWSEKATLVEVFADDKPGILYDIATVLADAGVSITHAKVSTRAEQVFDVFYVTGADGRKVENPDILEKIKEALPRALERDAADV